MKSVSAIALLFLFSCSQGNSQQNKSDINMKDQFTNIPEGSEVAIFGSGCFWCTEAIFASLKGVYSAESGYSGGSVKNPSYKEVCNGTTGHAEVVKVVFNPKEISFKELLEVFWGSHDPTTLNRQGADAGTQYRSAVFYTNDEQNRIASEYKKKLNDDKAFENPVVTEITAYTNFYKAEDYHQDYFALNGHEPYCSMVIKPKMDKFKKVFKDKLK